MEIANANSDVRSAVRDGSISATEARKAVRKHGDEAGKVIAESLETVKKAGKSRVTAKNIDGGTPTKSLAAAIQEEMDSAGKIKAEELCPRYANLIAYLRNCNSMKALGAEIQEF